MLKDKREAAGLGSPPEPFYTNDVESKYRVLKHHTSYKPQQLPEFVETMRSMYEDQKQEIERAVVGIGEYKLCPPYRALEVESKEWFKKNQKQRQRILERFAKAELPAIDTHQYTDYLRVKNVETSAETVDFPSSAQEDSATTSNPLSSTSLPAAIQQSMWSKMQSYIGDRTSSSLQE